MIFKIGPVRHFFFLGHAVCFLTLLKMRENILEVEGELLCSQITLWEEVVRIVGENA